jgi:hypothetical protein
MSPKLSTELAVVADTDCVPTVISDAVVCEKFPVTIADEIGLDE